MPRGERGILGVKKDPKKKMLFSFGEGRGAEDWPSDDSEDSDYQPDEYNTQEKDVKQEATQKRKRRKVVEIISEEDSDYDPDEGKSHSVKRKTVAQRSAMENKKPSPMNSKSRRFTKSNTKQNSKKRCKVVSAINKSDENATDKCRTCDKGITLMGNVWGAKIPPEVLMKIFGYVVDCSGALPFLARACRVCQLWNVVASDLALWKNVDLSYGWIKRDELLFHRLCLNKLAQVRRLDLTGWEKLIKDQQLTSIAENCPHLEEIVLTGCTKINADGLFKLVSNCPKLHSLNLSHAKVPQHTRLKSDFTMSKHLIGLLEEMGDRLRNLNLANHSLTNFNGVLKKMSSQCPQLKELDLTGVKFSSDFLSVDIEALQHGCPRLKALRLNCAMIRPTTALTQNWETGPGWDDLEELQVGTWDQPYSGIADTTLQRLLKTSCKLRILNIRGCKLLRAEVLSALCCSDLELLYMTWTKVPIQQSGHVANLLGKWNHSLQELDLAWCGSYCDSFSQDLNALCHPHSKLHTLDLSGSTIDMDALRSLLSGCQHISTLAVSSCRSLDTCYKRRYTGRKEVLELRKKLKL